MAVQASKGRCKHDYRKTEARWSKPLSLFNLGVPNNNGVPHNYRERGPKATIALGQEPGRRMTKEVEQHA